MKNSSDSTHKQSRRKFAGTIAGAIAAAPILASFSGCNRGSQQEQKVAQSDDKALRRLRRPILIRGGSIKLDTDRSIIARPAATFIKKQQQDGHLVTADAHRGIRLITIKQKGKDAYPVIKPGSNSVSISFYKSVNNQNKPIEPAILILTQDVVCNESDDPPCKPPLYYTQIDSPVKVIYQGPTQEGPEGEEETRFNYKLEESQLTVRFVRVDWGGVVTEQLFDVDDFDCVVIYHTDEPLHTSPLPGCTPAPSR